MARNGDLLPIDVFDWRYMQEQNINECLELVRTKFEFEDRHENYVVASLSKKWKYYKERLKKIYFNPDGDNSCPQQFIVEEQWKNLVQHWKDDTAKVEIDKIVASHSTNDSENIVIANENEIINQVVAGNNENRRFNRENYVNYSATIESSAGSYVIPLPPSQPNDINNVAQEESLLEGNAK
ncbi:hypothetical protein Taro_056013, partial [Colocasia esculenta]|nr:hypothetical protein [Colocasia esculenta]